jgi:hypothetical protein
MEAEVFIIAFNNNRAVIKVWNKDSNPDVKYQFSLLPVMKECGVSVTTPYGWGFDKDSNKVLLTSVDGVPILQIGEQQIESLANILLEIHTLIFKALYRPLLKNRN